MAKGGETVRLRGQVQDAAPGEHAPVFERVTVEAEGTSRSWIASRRDFDLIDDAGEAVRVELPEHVVVAAPEQRRKGPYGELREAYATVLPEDLALPYVDVKLITCVVSAGDVVEVHGEVRDVAFDDDGGPRSAPHARIGRVRAIVVAGGPDPKKAMDAAMARLAPAPKPAAAQPKAPRSTDPGHPATRPSDYAVPLIAALTHVVAAGLLVAFAGARGPALAVLALALALMWRPQRPARPFWQGTKELGGWFGMPFIWAVFADVFLVVVAFQPFRWLPRAIEPVLVAGVVLAALLVVSAVTYVLAFRRYAQILRAAPVDVARPGGWCAGEGVVRTPTPVRVRSGNAALALVQRWRNNYGSRQGDTLEGAQLRHEGTFVVEQDGLSVEVDPREVVWASCVRDVGDKGAGTIVREDEVAVPDGGRALWAGKLEPGDDGAARLRHDGLRPALLFATSAQGQPRGIVRKTLWERRITLAGLVIALGACAALLVLHLP